MGVQNLWELLAPVGRRVSVETLSGKKLAIDASIWLVQFIKAMRDEQGEMVRNAHLIGFFRRICKLLFLRTKPVFVFDGGTPALKRRTVIARRRQRENAQTKIRKTAEKLLLNQIKTMRVKELADKLANQRKENDLKRKKSGSERTEDSDLKMKGVVIENIEEGENVLLETVKEVEKSDLKGKSVMIEEVEVSGDSLKSDGKATMRFDQETLDAMLAASLAEEEDGGGSGNVSASFYDGIGSEDDDDGDEEMVLPVMDGKVDPAVLGALPPSMQLDLLVQMRERLMAENRQKYQKVKKAPAQFSELQIQSYLKTVAFRREINEVQKSAAGKGVGGVQTSRIASEANREYIFSSSFTGDKQMLTSAGAEKNRDVELQTTSKGPMGSAKQLSSVTLPSSDKESADNRPLGDLNDVETYIDERGRVRVSRVRAMGIRMTRDLQRNLDLMKEIQQEDSPSEQREAIFNKIVLGDPETFSVDIHQMDASNNESGVNSNFNDDEIRKENSQVPNHGSPMNISFFEDEIVNTNTDDDDNDNDLFAQLVAGSSAVQSSGRNDFPGLHPSDIASDCSWEEGVLDEENRMSLEKENDNDEDDVDWEEVPCGVAEDDSPSPTATKKATSKGSLEEEADIAKAIRLSLGDFTTTKEISEVPRELAKQIAEVSDLTIEKREVMSPKMPLESYTSASEISHTAVPALKNQDHFDVNDNLQNIEPVDRQFVSSRDVPNPVQTHEACKENQVTEFAASSKNTSECQMIHNDIRSRDIVSPVELKTVHLSTDQGFDASLECGRGISYVDSNCSSQISSNISAAVMGNTTEVNRDNAQQNDNIDTPTCNSYETTEFVNSVEDTFRRRAASSAYSEKKLSAEVDLDVPTEDMRITEDSLADEYNFDVPIEVSKASLDKEMLHLRQERLDLGDEQRKLERNAESVSSEMFAECQELLQMFGLPYIIAPMEAEAQCAYLELAKLVDGVVTDDSDVFLFGARSVYKNIFDDRKYVETYFMKDIESELGLTREQLVRMALLLGSDYTEGVSGIGIVNATEVLHAFPEEDGLQKFREWLESPDPSILGKMDTQSGSDSRKKGSNVRNDDTNWIDGDNVSEGQDDKQSTDNIQKTKQLFMDSHRNVSKNWHIPASFPSEAVISAYVSPQVDKSTESFAWGKPDLLVLRKLCWEKFGWNNQRADDLLLPVLKEYNKHETQLRLEAFYTFNERFAKIRSKRIKKVVKGITGKKTSELTDDLPKEASRKRSSPSEPDMRSENVDLVEDSVTPQKSTTKRPRRRKTEKASGSKEVVQEEDKESGNTRGRGRGRGRSRGRGRGRTVGRGRSKEDPGIEPTESSTSNEESDSQAQRAGTLPEVRRSTRTRKHIKYTEHESETPALPNQANEIDTNCIDSPTEQIQNSGQGVHRDPYYDVGEEEGEPIVKDGAHSDYLEMGGGFCMEEDNQENDSSRLSNHSHLENGITGDYLAMGGGFCVDDGDEGANKEPFSGLTRKIQNLESSSYSDVSNSIGAGLIPEDESLKTNTTTGLSPIPFLKRKRKKT